MFYFTADEHYGHSNIIKYCNRPFPNVSNMDLTLINNHNRLVSQEDVTIHAGDFTLAGNSFAQCIINQLNGKHIFLKGSHDYWLKNSPYIWEKKIEDEFVVVCHYAMRTWHRSHYNSWQLYGHSHGKLAPIGKQWDIGVDNNNFFPVSFEMLKEIMNTRPDNVNLIKR